MKKLLSKLIIINVLCVMLFSNIGCANATNQTVNQMTNQTLAKVESSSVNTTEISNEKFSGKTLNVKLGYSGKSYILELFENQTADDIYNHVSLATWNLPIYEFSGYENADKFQYYDIPSRYKVTSNPESIVEEKTGDIYYSEPNRMIMFFRDANIPVNYTKVGKIKIDEEFTKNVENNPELSGWGNKMIIISRAN